MSTICNICGSPGTHSICSLIGETVTSGIPIGERSNGPTDPPMSRYELMRLKRQRNMSRAPAYNPVHGLPTAQA
jgi:hypothetical protein